ncbi:NAD(P)H-dependent oxidoreductase, partial [bacterium]|nr:NAD(P)H-dependent oxidoreductase [bacterium]
EEFEKKDWREVEAYDYFVLGSPAHFGQMSWEMKKFFDEAFHMIYMSPGKAEGKLFALFSVGAGMPGAKSTVDSMEQAIDMNAGKVVLRLGLDKSMSADEFAAQAADFARSFAVLVGH